LLEDERRRIEVTLFLAAVLGFTLIAVRPILAYPTVEELPYKTGTWQSG
jgi:hypothetical protein